MKRLSRVERRKKETQNNSNQTDEKKHSEPVNKLPDLLLTIFLYLPFLVAIASLYYKHIILNFK